jgi:hypothetical protein
MTSLLQFTNMEKYANLDLTESHLRTSFQIFFYRLSFSFNKVETLSFAHPVQFF